MRIRKENDDLQEEEVLLIAEVSDALAHPVRIKLFRYVMSCNRSRTKVCNKDLVQEFNYSQATISQHMKKLQASQLVQVKKVDRFSYYYVNIGILGRYVKAVNKFE